MIILAIDPGTRTGWCVRRPDGSMESGTWLLEPGEFEGPGARYVRMRRHLVDALNRTQPGKVVYEKVRRHAGTDAAHLYGAIVGVIEEECERRGVHYEGIPVA